MDKMVDSLVTLGFTATEARVYLVLVRDGTATGYQVARNLGLSRSSVYSALDGLFSAGAVFLKDGEVSEYSPKDPKILIAERRKAYLESAAELETSLADFGGRQPSTSFFNIPSMEGIQAKARELIDGADRSLYMNTDFDLPPLEESLAAAGERGVRILLFSFRDYGDLTLPLEYYHRKTVFPETCDHHRMMIVADDNRTLVAGGSGSSYRGVFTANPLMARIVSEHIHLDIYIQKAGESFQNRINSGELLLGTLHESRL